MAGDSPYWLLLAGALFSRWLFAWASTGSKLWLVVGLCLLTLLGLTVTPMANLGSADLEYGLSRYGKVIGVLVLLEAWLMSTVCARYSYLSPASCLSVLYLQALLLQSGQLDFTFHSQSLLLAGCAITASLLLHFFVAPRADFTNLNWAHLAIVWLGTWLGLCSWPDNTGVNSTQHLRDTALLAVAIPLVTLCAMFFSNRWARLSKLFRGT